MANFPMCPWIHGIEAKHTERKAPSVSPSAAALEQHRQRGPSKPHGSATAFPIFKDLVYQFQRRIWLLGQGGKATNQELN